MQMRFKMFKAVFESWHSLFDQAAEFATSKGPERVVGISHSCDQNMGVVVVWYWDDGGTGFERADRYDEGR